MSYTFRKNIEDEIDIDVYNNLKLINLKEKELLKKEKELFEKEKLLLEKEKELFEREKKVNMFTRNKTSELIKLKIDNNYWTHNAFKDLVIEGDLDKLEWIKNNEGVIHFGVIDKAIKHSNLNVKNWFETYYTYLKTLNNFRKLLKFDIRYNFGNCCRIYTNLTTNVLNWYKKYFKGSYLYLNEIILNIFEYAIKCNNSLIIDWFEKNFEEFEELSKKIINDNLQIISKYYKEGYHRFWGYNDLRDVENQEWFAKYLNIYKKI
jgi:hypothetical protein